MKDKKHIIVSIDAEKAFDKIQHPFMIKTLQKKKKNGHRRNLPQHSKGHKMKSPQKTLFSMGKKMKQSPLRSGTRLLFNIVLEVLATAIGEEKERKGIQIGK